RDDRARLRARADHRPQCTPDEEQPEQETGEQQRLPEAADVGVLPALVAEPEVEVEAARLRYREPLPDERADDDHEQRAPERVHTEALRALLVAGDRRADVEPGAELRSRDPDHRELLVRRPV